MSSAIEINHISKLYRLGSISSGTLREDLHRWWTMCVRKKEDPWLQISETNDRSHQGNSNIVRALHDISFTVETGDVVGIIGKNGAGKSTLLKILSRITAPTSGTIRARGTIGSLLEVGTGFHPELSGRENIYMNGAILGMRKKEIRNKMDAIVDFSGCERYIDTPVKRYSSGMLVRLGFAVAAHLDPDVLIVDEVLAVGDAEFQKKAIGKMQEVSRGEGRTVLFVSHNMNAVRNLCKTGIVLHNGQLVHSGEIDSVIDYYLAEQGRRSALSIADLPADKQALDRQGNGMVRFTDFQLSDSNGTAKKCYATGTELLISVSYQTSIPLPTPRRSQINVVFKDLMGNKVSWISTSLMHDNIDFRSGKITFRIPKLLLSEGRYTFNLYCDIDGILADWLQDVGELEVVLLDFYGQGRSIPEGQGPLILPYEIID